MTPATAFRILIVEDEGIIANHIASRLVKTGYEVAGIAESSEEALAQMAKFEPELVLMDIRIKGAMDGIETAVKIRETWDVPVIYLTAHSDHETIDRAKLTGASGFLTKPIHHTSLATSIEMAIYKHRSDREMRHQRAWMATALGTMANAMIVLDAERKVQLLNRLAEELTGWTNKSAAGKDIAAVLPLTGSAEALAEIPGLFEADAPLRALLPRGIVAWSRSGRRFPVEGEVAVSHDAGLPVGFVVTFRDGSVRQEEETEIRHTYKMQAVGRLAAGIAHDFNNFLFVILGYAEELSRRPALGEPERRAVSEIRKAGDSASSITQQLLSFSRKEPIEKRELNLNDIVRESEDLFRRLAGVNVRWHFVLDPDLAAVRADAGQLKQALMNLVVNAREAMPTGGRITIETANVEAPRERVVAITVSDTGVGMTAETADRLFEPFFTTRGEGRGTGLGLSIVHSIVSDLGGSIHVDSEPDKGAAFTIYIPRAEPEVKDYGFAPEEGQAEPVTVLLAGLQGAVRGLLPEYLMDAGYTVLEARDREDALRISREYAAFIDLLIVDMSVETDAGFDLARQISSGRPGMKNMFVSGYAAELVERIDGVAPGTRLLPKPFRRRDLLNHVSELLGRRNHLTMQTQA
jgi:PAS domain S-box-containing protein